MKTKPTPGPWQSTHIATVHSGKLCVAVCNANRGEIEAGEALANASLIAAAPELLEACKNMLEYIEAQVAHDGKSLTSDELKREIARVRKEVSRIATGRWAGEMFEANLDAARAAIAKATGS